MSTKSTVTSMSKSSDFEVSSKGTTTSSQSTISNLHTMSNLSTMPMVNPSTTTRFQTFDLVTTGLPTLTVSTYMKIHIQH